MAKLYLWGAAALGFIVMIATIFTKAESVGKASEKLKNKTKELEEKIIENKAIKEKMKSDKSIEHTNRTADDDDLYSRMSKRATKDSDSV